MKGVSDPPVKPGDVIVLIGSGPLGTGMEETYQITSALKHLPWGKHVPIVTDGRFSGVSTGACIGHVGPEALAGGPLASCATATRSRSSINRARLEGSVNLVAVDGRDLSPAAAGTCSDQRARHPDLRPHPALPDDTRLWAALATCQRRHLAGLRVRRRPHREVIQAGLAALAQEPRPK